MDTREFLSEEIKEAEASIQNLNNEINRQEIRLEYLHAIKLAIFGEDDDPGSAASTSQQGFRGRNYGYPRARGSRGSRGRGTTRFGLRNNDFQRIMRNPGQANRGYLTNIIQNAIANQQVHQPSQRNNQSEQPANPTNQPVQPTHPAQHTAQPAQAAYTAQATNPTQATHPVFQPPQPPYIIPHVVRPIFLSGQGLGQGLGQGQ